MKQFFKAVFASTIGVLIGSLIVFLFGFSILVGMIASMGQNPEFKPTANTVYKLQLKGSISDNAESNPLTELLSMGEMEGLSLTNILKSIRLAKENDNIKGIYLEAGILSSSTANLKAIRRALIDFKESGKFVYAYGDYYTQGSYYLCSVADSVFVNPQGVVELLGMSAQSLFYPGLAEKAGVEFNIFKVGTYKSFVEPYMLKKYSDENREQLSSYMNSIWGEVTSSISEARNIDKERLNEYINEGLSLNKTDKAVEYNLIDATSYKSEMEDRIKQAAGIEGKDKLKYASLNKMVNIKDKKKEYKDKIAVVFAEGEIREAAAGSPFSNDQLITQKVAEQLRKLKDDEDVKAVVLRVNSPGGSAFVSEQIWKEVVELKKEKPVVASMGGVAASGGYYISCGASKIIAESTTVTGSIGVFGIIMNLSGTINKLGVTSDHVNTNKYSDIGNPFRPMREDEKAIIQTNVEQTYDLFLTRCADGRGLDKAEIDKIGQGRVWTGTQALEIGLVDQLGGLDTAIEEAALLANIDEYSVTTKKSNKDFFTEFFEKKLDDMQTGIVKKALGSDYNLFETLKKTKMENGIYARLPFDATDL